MSAGLLAAGMAIQGMGMLGGRGHAEDQIWQQRELTEIQRRANEQLMRKSYDLQKGMYDYTFNKNTPSEQRRLYEEAGMNPALAYTQGAVGSPATGGGGTSVGGGTASDEASRIEAETGMQGMALQKQMMMSQIKLNESVANKNNKEAGKTEEETTNIQQTRDLLIANLKEENQSKFIENLRSRWNDAGSANLDRLGELNEATGQWHSIEKDANYNNEVVSAILKTQAETGNAAAQELLTNKKAQGYYQELVNATLQADADAIKAASVKLCAEWSTGEYTNWRTWADLAKDGTKMVGDLIGNLAKSGRRPNKGSVNK